MTLPTTLKQALVLPDPVEYVGNDWKVVPEIKSIVSSL